MGDHPLSRRGTVVLALGIATLLVSGAAAAYLRQGPREVTVDDAVAAFRASAATVTTTTTPTSVSAPPPPASAEATEAPDPGAPAAPTAPATPSATVAPAGRTTTAPTTPVTAGSGGAATDAAPSAPTRAEPEPGVYTYATQGYEATNALGGARHDYPAETPVTMQPSECGWTQRWQPLRERWDESALCRGADGIDISRFTTYHEFFQRSQQQQFDCPPGSRVHRWDAPAGTTWTWRCTAAGGSAIDSVVTVVGEEELVIGGQPVPTVRVRYESTMTGANRGTQLQERWMRRTDGMNVRIKTDIDTEADSPFGAVHYEEHYTITLASLTPRR
jgi:hypothetical protein